MKYTQIPVTLQQELQMNAGILVKSFNPDTGEIAGIIGATSGGVNFTDVPEYNCPKNTKELKRITGRKIKVSGSFVSLTPENAKRLVGSGDMSDTVKVVPRDDILSTDFETIWFIGDYSDVNTGASAGYIAIKLMNVLNTSGFSIQTSDAGKGTFSFEFTAHYSMESYNVVPYEIYVKAGTSSEGASITLDRHETTVAVGDTVTLTAATVPAGQTVTWSSAATATATVTSGGVVEGKVTGNTIVTASITKDGVTYTDTCTVIVIAAS